MYITKQKINLHIYRINQQKYKFLKREKLDQRTHQSHRPLIFIPFKNISLATERRQNDKEKTVHDDQLIIIIIIITSDIDCGHFDE